MRRMSPYFKGTAVNVALLKSVPLLLALNNPDSVMETSSVKENSLSKTAVSSVTAVVVKEREADPRAYSAARAVSVT